jgi:methylated-DNA-[protein]-cysteine S-methyltransferase
MATERGVIHTDIPSPLGPLRLVGDGETLAGLHMDAHRHGPGPTGWGDRRDEAFTAAKAQLAAWFAGELETFDLPLAPAGTPFQRRVWDALLEIPYGTTTTYGDLARRLGDPKAVRAVGLANGRNPIPIIIPCHRVVGADGSLTGYGGGLERKRWLLHHEAAHAGLRLA